jgi:hypothetical protein
MSVVSMTQVEPQTEAGRRLVARLEGTARRHALHYVPRIEQEAAAIGETYSTTGDPKRPWLEHNHPDEAAAIDPERLTDAIAEAMNHVPWPGEQGVTFGGMTFRAAAEAIVAAYNADLSSSKKASSRVGLDSMTPADEGDDGSVWFGVASESDQ